MVLMRLTFFPFEFHLASHKKPKSCNIIHYSLLIRTRQINYDPGQGLTTTIAFVIGQAGSKLVTVFVTDIMWLMTRTNGNYRMWKIQVSEVTLFQYY
jgi:hypothetical protein